jgi:hypothetical protein
VRLTTSVLILVVGLAISAAVWFASGGRFMFLFLPLLFGLPLIWGRRRGP